MLSLLPQLDITSEERSRSLILRGSEHQVDDALRLLISLDREIEDEVEEAEIIEELEEPEEIEDPEELIEEEEEEFRIINVHRLKHSHAEDIKEIVESIFPEMDVEIDARTESLIVQGTRAELDQVAEVLLSLDERQQQVLIEVRIEEISLTAAEELGIPDLSQIEFFRFEDGEFTGELPTLLEALQRDDVSETLARPRLTTLDGQEARLLIGDRIPFPIRDAAGDVVEIDYIDAGINLEFLPRITDDGFVTLEVHPEISSFESAGEELPRITTREAQTMVRVRDGETFALGGLIQDEEMVNYSRIPFLSELPLIGRFFTRRRTEERKTEIIIFLTPHIIDEEELLIDEDMPEELLEELEEEKEKNDEPEQVEEEPKEKDDKKNDDLQPEVEDKVENNNNNNNDNEIENDIDNDYYDDIECKLHPQFEYTPPF